MVGVDDDGWWDGRSESLEDDDDLESIYACFLCL